MSADSPSTGSASANSGPAPRVALFTGAYNHIADGVSLTLNRLVGHLNRRGVEVLVFAPTVEDPPVDHEGTMAPVRSIPAPGREEYRISLGLSSSARQRLVEFDPALVHIATPDLLGYQALRFAQRRNLPLVASYHTHFGSYLKYYRLSLLQPLIWRYLRWFYRQCRHIYVPTAPMAQVLIRKGVTRGLRLWGRGVETDRFTPARRSMEWRRTHGIADDELVVGFVSRLVWEKGLDVYADVIDALRARGYAVQSLVVGDGPARAELEDRLSHACFTGYLEGTELATAYASSDVFLFPSDTEAFGNVTLEAMASGLPTVCADAVGSRHLVEHETTGLLCPPGHTEAFTNAVARLLDDDDLRRRMGRRAREHADAYDWETVLDRIPAYYDEVVGAPIFSSIARDPSVSQPTL